MQAGLRYDPNGRLYEVTGPAGTTRMLYDGDALTAEYNGSGILLRRYVHGADAKADDPIAWYEGASFNAAAERHLRPDWQGSIVLVTDSSGATALAVNRYDEYGIPQSTNSGRFQYTGQAWIAELGMYYYKARIYSPTLGRFLQTDPIGYEDQVNLYAYVRNDPVNGVDPTGMVTTGAECDTGSRVEGGSPTCKVMEGFSGQQRTRNKAGNTSPATSTSFKDSSDSRRDAILEGVDTTLDELHKVASQMTPSKATKFFLRLEGKVAFPIQASILYRKYREEGFSHQASLAGVIAATGTSYLITISGSGLGGALGSLVAPGPGTYGGALGGGAVASGADIFFGWSEKVGRKAADDWDRKRRVAK